MKLRGEYWIEDGEVADDCSGVGQHDHVSYALQAAVYHLLAALDIDTDEADGQEVTIIIRNFLDEEEAEPCTPVRQRLLQWIREHQPEDEHLVDPAFDMAGDIREYAMKTWGWYWVKTDWIGTHKLTQSDFNRISSGLWNILDSEGKEPDSKELREEEIRIRVMEPSRELWISIGALFDRDYGAAGVTDAEREAPVSGALRNFEKTQMPEAYKGKFGD